jgi:hypothetical protein
VNLGVRFAFLLLITTIVVVPTIFLRDIAIGWLLLDINLQHNMTLSLISRPVYFSVVIWVLIWRNVTSFAYWLIVMGVLCVLLFPLAIIGLEVTDARVGVLALAPEPEGRYALYGLLFLFELLMTFVIAGVTHRILVGIGPS